jgi:hypothetical protein
MYGIAGFIGSQQQKTFQELKSIADDVDLSLRHRGADAAP